MKIYQLLFPGLIVAGSLLHAGQADTLDPAFLARLRSEAIHNHPAVAAARLRANATAEDIRAVRLWNDPMLGLSFMGAEKMMRQSDGDVILGFEVALPKPGLFAANKSKAEAMWRAEAETSRASSLETGSVAARTAIELALSDEVISLQSSQLNWISNLTQNARERSAGPDSSSLDALRMESELARETQVLEAAKRSRDSISRKLNLNLGRPLESPWPSLKLPPSPSPVPVAAAEIARISRANPRVRSLIESAGAARAETRSSNAERLPEVSVGAEAAAYSGNGDVTSTTFGLKVSLPWFNDPVYTARTTAARNRESAATSDVETLRREIAGNVLTITAEAANAAAQARAYSGEIYQRALEATRAVEVAWISSKAPLSEVLETNRILFSLRLEQRRFVAMQLAALEELQLLVPTTP